ncbi:MAG: proteasome subunit beta [Thermoproteota archaeon]|jgi:proteasome beta subunit|nr:proteasome subunit beta [Thermoproteota archaeon]
MANILELTGATVIGLVYSTGVILAGEKRVAIGNYLLSKGGKKVFKIMDNLGIASAGILADMQAISKIFAYDLKMYELENKRPPTVRSAAKLLSNILYSRKYFPFLASVIVGGIDYTGKHIFSLDPIGSLIEDKYVSLGSGSELSLSILESEYSEDLPKDKAVELAYKSVKIACGRDVLSGDGVDLLVIDEKGTEELFRPLK